MDVEEKIGSFKLCAKKLCDESRDFTDYNASANRFWYYIFRLIKKKLEDRDDYKYVKGEFNANGSHDHLIKTVKFKMQEAGRTLYLRSEVNGALINMYSKRLEADYDDNNICNTDIETIKTNVKFIENILDKI